MTRRGRGLPLIVADALANPDELEQMLKLKDHPSRMDKEANR